MSKQKSRFPVSSFGSDLQAVLREGAEKELRLTFPTDKIATRFMHRINSLRSAMRKEGHRDWEQYYRAGIYKDRGNPSVVIIAPRDYEFKETIQKAGVQTVDDSAPPLAAPSGDTVDDFLSSLRTPKKNAEG